MPERFLANGWQFEEMKLIQNFLTINYKDRHTI